MNEDVYNKKGMSFQATLTIDKEVMSSLAKYLKETDDEILDGIFSGKQELILHNSKRGTAELSRVVRCKDCKYWQPHTQRGFDEDNDEYHNYCGYHMPDDEWYAEYWEADDYCSYGKRGQQDDENE